LRKTEIGKGGGCVNEHMFQGERKKGESMWDSNKSPLIYQCRTAHPLGVELEVGQRDKEGEGKRKYFQVPQNSRKSHPTKGRLIATLAGLVPERNDRKQATQTRGTRSDPGLGEKGGKKSSHLKPGTKNEVQIKASL